jgi:hypothetical protein
MWKRWALLLEDLFIVEACVSTVVKIKGRRLRFFLIPELLVGCVTHLHICRPSNTPPTAGERVLTLRVGGKYRVQPPAFPGEK